jgi:hypothetical protein
MGAILRRLPALAGLAVLAGTCAQLAGHRAFARLVRRAVQALHARASPSRAGVVTEQMLADLPEPVRRYLRYAGVVGKPFPGTVRLRQKGRMRLAPGQPWIPLDGQEHYSVQPPGFVWAGTVRLGPLPVARARDMYADGGGGCWSRSPRCGRCTGAGQSGHGAAQQRMYRRGGRCSPCFVPQRWVTSVREVVVVLLQTPAVPGIRPAPGDPMCHRNRSCRRRRLPAVAASQEPVDPGDRWLRPGAGAARVLSRPGQPGHGCTAGARSQPARIAGGQRADGHGGASGLICWECGGHRYLDYSRACPCWQKIRGPCAIGEGRAAYQQHPGLPSRAGGTTFRRNPAGEAP